MCFFFFNDTATTEIYTLSLHDALPIYARQRLALAAVPDGLAERRLRRQQPGQREVDGVAGPADRDVGVDPDEDRKSTRLNSSHANISYAVFCLKKKKN